MIFIKNNLQEWADKVYYEIENDSTPYFHPVNRNHKIFEESYMKFVNRNLNYYNFSNMVVCALKEPPEWNPQLKVTLEFCNFVKTFMDEESTPFGRMCVWNVPPRKRIKKHTDNFTYHAMIDRYIFFVSSHPAGSINVTINNEKANTDKGVLWKFNPAFDEHEFVNNSDDPLYFLGFDIWKKEKLYSLKDVIDVDSVIQDPARLSRYGGQHTTCKFISEH
jgi:hypothetical protein